MSTGSSVVSPPWQSHVAPRHYQMSPGQSQQPSSAQPCAPLTHLHAVAFTANVPLLPGVEWRRSMCLSHRHVPVSAVQRPTYNIFLSFHRLIKAPKWTPPVHVRIHRVRQCQATSFDIIPQQAQALETISALLQGQCVPATVRIQKTCWPINKAAAVLKLGQGNVEDSVVDEWLNDYRGCAPRNGSCVGLSLIPHNCWHFAAMLVGQLKHGGDVTDASQ